MSTNINIITKKKIIKYICNNFNQSPTCIDEYIRDNSFLIAQAIDNKYEADDIIIQIGDSNSDNYYKFIRLFQNELKDCYYTKIRIEYEQPFYYIINKCYSKNMSINRRKKISESLDSVLLINDNIKGHVYEKFCRCLLQDIGIDVKKPKSDKGIDILGKLHIDYKNPFLDYCNFEDYIYLLAQVKCYEDEVGTKVINDLIADSQQVKYCGEIGYRPTLLVVFSYNGFSRAAIKFAKEHEVYLITNDMLLDLLCSADNKKEFKCLKYLQEIN